ncbi:MAG TPA: CBS domain-containing protein [Anaeromyxobacter sp.]
MANEDVLEGDEGEPEVGRHRDVGHVLRETPLAEVRPSAPATLRADAPVSKAVDLMRSRKATAIVVVERARTRRVVGIFTERDLVDRALPSRGWAGARVSRYMTRAPETLRPQDPIAYAINKMSAGGFRHVPLVDGEGRPAGIVSASDLMTFLAELCPEEVLNLPPEPELAAHPRAEGE